MVQKPLCSEKAEVLAAHFSGKMTVPDPRRFPPAVPRLTKETLDTITITSKEVKHQLTLLNPKKPLGPDDILKGEDKKEEVEEEEISWLIGLPT
ncbi:hypothetical protein E2C01_034053 [Portunus trituberculatus]|uniref:Uncharacterized protein n=1 Tax=Portunus trituberculatus TaxID=210409 RepID=A0A5B7F7H1_PORTR|nr:hypothetical protein [Portunus trituberculatus]